MKEKPEQQALLSKDKSENNSLGLQQQKETMRLDRLMISALNYYAAQDLSTETALEYREELKRLVSIHGIDRVESSMKSLRLKSKFFPHPAEVNEHIEAAIVKESAESRWANQQRYQAEKEAQAKAQHEEVMKNGGYVSMADVLKDFYERKKRKG